MLLGNVHATPVALDRAGLNASDIGVGNSRGLCGTGVNITLL